MGYKMVFPKGNNGGGNGGGGTTVIQTLPSPRPTATMFKPGRKWYTDFTNTTYDALYFEGTGVGVEADSGGTGTPQALHLSAYNAQGWYLTKAKDIRDFDIRIKYRLAPNAQVGTDGTGMAAGHQLFHIIGRHQANTEYVAANVSFGGTGQISTGYFKTGSGTLNTTAVTPTSTVENTNTSTYRYFRFRVIGDFIYSKTWFDGSVEPDWQSMGRINYNTTTTSGDFVDAGACGVSMNNGGVVAEIQITELINVDHNLLINADLQMGFNKNVTPVYVPDGTSSINCPLGWENYTSPLNGNILTIEDGVDPWGDTRKLFKCVKTVTGNNAGYWEQSVWSGNELGATTFGARRKKYPYVDGFPNWVEVSVWSKGQNMALTAGNMGAACVVYMYSEEGAIAQDTSNYWATLGPNGLPQHKGGGLNNKFGTGTWDWYETKWRMPIPPSIVRLAFRLTVHDANATGTFWVCNPVVRPVG